MQALHRHKQGMNTVAVARQVYRDHGVAGFFKGLMPSMVMVVNPTIQVGPLLTCTQGIAACCVPLERRQSDTSTCNTVPCCSAPHKASPTAAGLQPQPAQNHNRQPPSHLYKTLLAGDNAVAACVCACMCDALSVHHLRVTGVTGTGH
jgi:hypothetical protein